MQERVKLTPLTQEERMFSEENYPVLEWCIRINCLDQDSYDVAYLGYIHAVKKWHAREDLHRWSFRTIANKTIRSHLGNEKRKTGRQIQTVSLEEVIPGTDGLTYGDTITEENIRFLRKDADMETKRQVRYDIPIPEVAKMARIGSVSVDTEMLINFLGSEHRTMCFEYENKKEASASASRFRSWKRTHKRDDFNIYKFEEKVYIEKTIKKGTKQNGKCKDQPVRD